MGLAAGSDEGLGAIRDEVRSFARDIPDGFRRYEQNDRDFLRENARKHDPKYAMDRTHDRGVGADEGRPEGA